MQDMCVSVCVFAERAVVSILRGSHYLTGLLPGVIKSDYQ